MKVKLKFGLYWIVELIDAGVDTVCVHIRNEDGSKEFKYEGPFALQRIDEIAKEWGDSVGATHVTFVDIAPLSRRIE